MLAQTLKQMPTLARSVRRAIVSKRCLQQPSNTSCKGRHTDCSGGFPSSNATDNHDAAGNLEVEHWARRPLLHKTCRFRKRRVLDQARSGMTPFFTTKHSVMKTISVAQCPAAYIRCNRDSPMRLRLPAKLEDVESHYLQAARTHSARPHTFCTVCTISTSTSLVAPLDQTAKQFVTGSKGLVSTEHLSSR